MNNLARIRQMAQATADREGRAVVILNLNLVGSAMYVVREDWPDADANRAFVARVEPSGAVLSCEEERG